MKAHLGKITRGMNILIVDDVHELLIKGLEAAGFHVLYLPVCSRHEMMNRLAEMHILVIRTKTFVDAAVMHAAPHLVCIARAGAGLDNIDLAHAQKRNITCINAGEANADAVGEQTIGMLLMLLNNLCRADKEVRNRVWRREANRGVELSGKTVGIIGFGNTGRSVAAKLSGFGVKVLAYDKYLSGLSNAHVYESSPEQIFEEADVLSLHVPLTNETGGMVNHAFLSRFKKNIYLLNLSRGKVVNTHHLVAAVKSGKVLGCALDVLENEELGTLDEAQDGDFSFLASCDNVVLSPHIGGWTVESYRKISQILLDKLLTLSESS